MTLALGNHDSKLLPLAYLLEPPNPSRTEMDEGKLAELADSMRQLGVLQHLIVVPTGDRYEIIAGHRRYYAAMRAGLAVVPCDVYPDRRHANEAAQHAENRFREELAPADEAIWFDELLERKCGGDTDRLAAYLGEKRGYVESRLSLFSGDKQVFEALRQGKIGIGVAIELNRCDNEIHRRGLLHSAISGGATVALVHGWIAEYVAIHKPALPQDSSPAPAPASGPVPEFHFFRCALCDGEDNVGAMQPKNMHTYCFDAMFMSMRTLYERRHEFTRWPRTLEEASVLINDLVERFPGLLPPDSL